MLVQRSHVATLLCVLFLNNIGPIYGEFTSYWNIPIETCMKNGVYFDLSKYDIIHNTNDTFYGDKVNIMYKPGLFPLINDDDTRVNGGIPQEGNLTEHIMTFQEQVENTFPLNYIGPAVLDFEVYLPSYEVSLPQVYKDQSEAWVRTLHPEYTPDMVQREAQRTFDLSVKPYFESLLREGRTLRPGALFGYYHYPYCHNYAEPFKNCETQVMEMNDDIQDLVFNNSGALYPSVYTFNISTHDRWNTISTKLAETNRVNKAKLPVFPYFWYRFHETPEFLPPRVALTVLWLVRANGGDGTVLWGSSYDLADKQSCAEFQEYFNTVLGPLVKCFHDLPQSFIDALKRRYPTEHATDTQFQPTNPLFKPASNQYQYQYTEHDNTIRNPASEFVGDTTFKSTENGDLSKEDKDFVQRYRYHKLHNKKETFAEMVANQILKHNRETILELLSLYCNVGILN